MFKSKPPLGDGRFGTVYQARDDKTGEEFAAKVFEADGDSDLARQICAREHQMLRAAQGRDNHGHTNIIRLVAQIDPRCLLLQRADHGDLLDLLQDYTNRGLSGDTTQPLMLGVFAGLDFIHSECRLMHGDLKPENILLVSETHPVIADFDTAVELGTSVHNVRGTLEFAPPEYQGATLPSATRLARGATDVWAAGVIFIVAVTGVYPWNISPPDSDEGTEDDDCYWLWREEQQLRPKSLAPVVKPWKYLDHDGCIRNVIVQIICQQDPKLRPAAKNILEMIGDTSRLSMEVETYQESYQDELNISNASGCCACGADGGTDSSDWIFASFWRTLGYRQDGSSYQTLGEDSGDNEGSICVIM